MLNIDDVVQKGEQLVQKLEESVQKQGQVVLNKNPSSLIIHYIENKNNYFTNNMRHMIILDRN
ncbi:hypothetical protein FLK61_24380 [Paenalkalicoccus suaedae]|uniref:Uncharacterized protein n=1 Tax=Paenalkalicoccus suaedae TaxID=2592382 RepID=A0A859FAW4_9BACI|nr:hypothetical protein [Paenalkalicoccus suaedae]QKS69922.1 hypothetical protein FLK61_24380 [Paenalkalicoccus suaedae]